jgi:hypothetical protein
MSDAIRHRGPDDFGFYHDSWAHLGQRRLSIVDIEGGHQPMSNETGALWITFNGEIYNHAALRPALERAGHRYQSHSIPRPSSTRVSKLLELNNPILASTTRTLTNNSPSDRH